MESVLIVSGKGSMQRASEPYAELLRAASVKQIVVLESAAEARRMILERDFDLVVVNAPLRDESGENLCQDIVSKGASQAILVVKSESFNAVSAVCEAHGVLTVSKPVNNAVFWSALSLAKSARSRILRVQEENTRLKQKIEDIRIVDKAKHILIAHLNLSESEAHRFIEKQAMDLRSSRRAIAEGILKTYKD